MPNPPGKRFNIIQSNTGFYSPSSPDDKKENLARLNRPSFTLSPSTLEELQRQTELRKFAEQQQARALAERLEHPQAFNPSDPFDLHQYVLDMRTKYGSKSNNDTKDTLGVIILKKTADVNGVAGFAGGGIELTNTTASIGTNLKIYKTGWNGNKYVSTIKVLKAAKTVGTYTLVGGVLIDIALTLAGAQSGDKLLLNTAVGVGTFLIGGPAGLIIGIGYFAMDQAGLFDTVNKPISRPDRFTIQPDATRTKSLIFLK